MLTKLSLKNVAIVVLVALLILLAGAYSIPRLGIEFLPEIAPPVVAIVTVYPNASPDAVAHDVTKPIEEKIGSMSSLENLSSVSNENLSVVIADFSYGMDMEKIEEKITSDINKIKGDLPDTIIEPKIFRYNLNDSPIMSLSVTSEGGQALTSRIVKDIIKPEIEKVPGVASVEISGLAEKRYEVILNPDELKAHKLTSAQVIQVLKANNLTMPGGTIDIETKSIPIQTISRIKTKEDLEKLIVSVGIDQAKFNKMQADSLKSAQISAMKAQEKAMKKAFEMQQKIIMNQIQGAIADAMKNQMKQLPGGQLPPGLQSPGDQMQVYPYPGDNVQAPRSPGGISEVPGIDPNQDSTLTPGQTDEKQRSYNYRSKPRVIQASTQGMDSFSSPDGGSMGSFSALSISGAGSSSEDVPLKIVYLSDVARVTEAYNEGTSLYRTNEKPSIGMDIKKGSKQNTVAVADAVIEKIAELEKRAGDGTKITITSNQADYIKNALDGMTREGILGALFAVLVIFFFLRNVRATLVSAISIPLSVIIGLIFLYIADISLNMFTLGGITIAIGRIVDDSIVVLENIFRHMQSEEGRLSAVISGTSEVARAITSSTITTVAVFLPLGFIKGFVGELFRPFAYTVTLTLLASLLVAVTIVPVLAAKFMSKKSVGRSKGDGFLRRNYLAILKWSLKRKVFVLGLSIVLFISSLAILPYIPRNFISQPNKGTFIISMEMPVGTSLTTTSKIISKVESILAKDSRIKEFRALIGSAQGSYASGNGSNAGTIYATVRDKTVKEEVVKGIRLQVEHIDPEAKIAVSGAEEVAGMGNTIEVNITANSYDDLRIANSALMKELSNVKEVANVKSNLSQSKPELWVEVNEVLAMKKGLTAIQVAAAVRSAINGESATTLENNGVSTNVFVCVDKNKVKDRETLASLPIVTPFGGTISLDTIARVKMATGPVNITRINQERSATLTMEPIVKNTGAATRAVQETVKSIKLPAGAGATVEGISAMMDKGFASMSMALLVAILLVYIVMVATFRSLLHPFTMMFSLPLAVIGAVMALYVTGRELGMPSLIGVLMLVGIVVTNAIVLLDLVQQLRAKGYSAYDAIIQAGSTRMRPILMTAIATILALVPMAVGSTEGGIISAPLATVVIGGLLTSTLLTLLVIPVLYMTFDSLRERIGVADSSFVSRELVEDVG
ncbi:MAG: efflux RND transporter permease subunit [Actinobacteria bacterium]|nr:efflux RND transporter permease subunit [Actinomycetota bacterium]